MRDIKFRGYSEEHGWIYGYYTQDAEGRAYITEVSDGVDLSYEVDIKTIGEFTGLQDKNGRDIYEGDILFDSEIKRLVEWVRGTPRLSTKLGRDFLAIYATDLHHEIIGNIHDKPELIIDNKENGS